ncbi:hypothetical protein CPC08DRAFT_758853 [Agrocybe pediades]|nr:hypothetical protein CPC08DRAFT_758853 [Agrocybe pediades]
MLILASILFSRSSNSTGSFSSFPDAVFSQDFPRDADPMPPCPRQRIQIIWTCVATILAASWVSVHPNIPNPKESAIKKMLRRIELMTWAIISPELMIYWAMRQWYGARVMERWFAEVQKTKLEPLTGKILHRLKKLGYQLCNFRERKDEERSPSTRPTPRMIKEVKWTRTHGFFLQMGGFMLREEGQNDRVLGWETLVYYYMRGRLDLSEVTEDRINDHSKADGFAKGLALLQMFWFIAQCIARFFDKNLVLTELELATAALALLSLVMYFLWWNKPFNACVPITITLLPTRTDSQSKDNANCRLQSVAHSIHMSLPIPDMLNSNIPHAQPVEVTQRSDHGVDEIIPSVEVNPLLRQSVLVNPPASRSGSVEVNNADFSHMLSALPSIPQSAHPRAQSQPKLDRSPRSPTIGSADKTSGGFQWWFLFMRIDEILDHRNVVPKLPSDDPNHSVVTSVPSFYSLPLNAITMNLMGLTSFSAAALFGSIHCIGWSSKIVFASHAASLAWRIASAVITAGPVTWCIMLIFE